ncbi:PP2C family protein-serine/threonine phosphatase [Kitasatospora indigofera]|uniref:PP2C family protein-serine/threonine phosphatase n=1 Tax=Kitasatospora indigofera TaxID=67307 RepID=UPI00367E901F
MRWSSAGHPPPLLLPTTGSRSDGRARYLEAGQGIVLGAGGDPERPTGRQQLPAGSTLLLFTDGLVEVPGADLGAGLEELRRLGADLTRYPLEDFCDRILEAIPSGSTDDTALLAVRVPPG